MKKILYWFLVLRVFYCICEFLNVNAPISDRKNLLKIGKKQSRVCKKTCPRISSNSNSSPIATIKEE